METQDIIQLFFSALEAVGIVGALLFTARQQRDLQNEIRFQAHNATVDRMYQIRTLLINDPDLYMIWDGGVEGEVLKEAGNHKYFYLTKMLLHMNESLFLEMIERGVALDTRNATFGPWRENLKTDLTAPHFRNVWTQNRIVRESYNPVFQKEVNKIIAEIEDGKLRPNNMPAASESNWLDRFRPVNTSRG